ncbi:MAG: hypothetical protein V4582_16675 [Pseudomonadota bacterium]
MELDARLLAEQRNLIKERDLLLAEAKVFADQRKTGDTESRRTAGKEATRLRRLAQQMCDELEQITVALDLLGHIIASLNRRQEMAHYHYSNWLEVEEKGVYAAKAFQKLGGDGYVNAIKFNAEVLAFLQNVHAICDSFPFALNLYLRSCDFGSRSIGWNEKTMEAFRLSTATSGEIELFNRVERFFADEVFLTLQGIVNCAKHKHLVPIYFNGTKTVFGKLDGKSGHSDLVVKEVMIKVHDVLLPLLIEMLRLVSADDQAEFSG